MSINRRNISIFSNNVEAISILEEIRVSEYNIKTLLIRLGTYHGSQKIIGRLKDPGVSQHPGIAHRKGDPSFNPQSCSKAKSNMKKFWSWRFACAA